MITVCVLLIGLIKVFFFDTPRIIIRKIMDVLTIMVVAVPRIIMESILNMLRAVLAMIMNILCNVKDVVLGRKIIVIDVS